MKDKGKTVDHSNGNWFSDYSSSSDIPCRKHPSSSTVGICAFCLKDRLIKLVCSDCGEQRLSSCSCSDISSSYPTSCSVEVGSVGRISFLIENEKSDIPDLKSNTRCEEKSDSVLLLKRSSSSSSAVIKSSGFWRFGRIFRKKREKGIGFSGRNVGGFDEKGEMWVFDYMGISRSKSLRGFRGCFDESEEGEGGGFSVSGSGASEIKRNSVILESEREGGSNGVDPIVGGFGGDNDSNGPSLVSASDFEGVKKGGFLGFESGFNGVAENGFNGVEDSGFIDLKLGFSSESKPEISGLKFGDLHQNSKSGFSGLTGGGDISLSKHECNSFGHSRAGIFSDGNSCRITDKGIKKSKRSFKVWRWISWHHPNGKCARKKDKQLV